MFLLRLVWGVFSARLCPGSYGGLSQTRGVVLEGLIETLRRLIRGDILRNDSLDSRTTYRIGGPAEVLVCPKDLADLRQLNAFISEQSVPKFVLGGGANVLVSDQGFKGIVVHLSHFDELKFDGCCVSAGAGLILDNFVVSCLRRGLGGLERLSGIPGTLGGALRMNAGAFDAEISDYLINVQVMDYEGHYHMLPKTQVGFAYRTAPLIKEAYILGATFNFPTGSKEELFRIRQEILARRYEKQPWQYPSAGSVFKRPPGYFAGKLIEDVGLKGRIWGRAQISTKHAGIIINLGGAKASDVLGLIRLAQSEVRKRFQIELELEQELVGF
jgi:UDP-N-acetylmuramate dehydrogenase